MRWGVCEVGTCACNAERCGALGAVAAILLQQGLWGEAHASCSARVLQCTQWCAKGGHTTTLCAPLGVLQQVHAAAGVRSTPQYNAPKGSRIRIPHLCLYFNRNTQPLQRPGDRGRGALEGGRTVSLLMHVVIYGTQC